MDLQVSSKSGVGLVAHAQAAMVGRNYPDDLETFRQAAGDLAVNADAFQRTVDKLEQDGFYTRKGLPEQVRAEALKYRQAVVGWRQRHVDSLATQERALLAEASKPAPARAEDLIVRVARHREIRDLMRGLPDPIDRQLAVSKAADAGDADFLAAVAGSPRGFELVPAEVISKARSRMAAAASPELVRVQTLKGAYEQVAAVAGEELRNVLTRFGIELDQPAK